MTTAGTPAKPLAPLLRAAVVPSLAAGLACAFVAAATAGTRAVWGAALGTTLVVGFFWVGQATLNAVRWSGPGTFFVIAVLTYTLQVVVLLAVLASFRRHDGWDAYVSTTAMGVTIIVTTAVWTVGLIVAAMRERVVLYDLGRWGA